MLRRGRGILRNAYNGRRRYSSCYSRPLLALRYSLERNRMESALSDSFSCRAKRDMFSTQLRVQMMMMQIQSKRRNRYFSTASTESSEDFKILEQLERITTFLLNSQKNPLGTMTDDFWDDAFLAMEYWTTKTTQDGNNLLSGYAVDSVDRLLQRLMDEHITQPVISQNRRPLLIEWQQALVHAWLEVAEGHDNGGVDSGGGESDIIDDDETNTRTKQPSTSSSSSVVPLVLERAERSLLRAVGWYNRGWATTLPISAFMAVVNAWLRQQTAKGAIHASELLLSWSTEDSVIVSSYSADNNDDDKREQRKIFAHAFQEALDQCIRLVDDPSYVTSVMDRMEWLAQRGWEDLQPPEDAHRSLRVKQLRLTPTTTIPEVDDSKDIASNQNTSFEVEAIHKKMIDVIKLANENDIETIKSLDINLDVSLEIRKDIFIALIDYYVRIGDVKTATQWLQQLDQQLSNSDDKVDCLDVIKIFERVFYLWVDTDSHEAPWRADELFKRIKEIHHAQKGDEVLDSNIYNQLINIWIKQGKSVAARKVPEIFWQMYDPLKRDDNNRIPNLRSLHILLEALLLESSLTSNVESNLRKVIMILKQKNWNQIVMSSEKEELRSVLELTMDLIASRNIPDVANFLIQFIFSQEHWAELRKRALEVCGNSLTPDELLQLVKKMENADMDGKSCMSLESYEIAISLLLEKRGTRRIDELEELINRILDHADGSSASELKQVGTLIEKAVDAVARMNQPERADAMLRLAEEKLFFPPEKSSQLEQQKVAPITRSCFSLVMEKFAYAGDWDKIIGTFHRLNTHYKNGYRSLIPDHIAYRTYQNAISRRYGVKRAEAVLMDAIHLYESTGNEDSRPDSKMFNNIFHAYFKEGTEEALKKSILLLDRRVAFGTLGENDSLAFNLTMKLLLEVTARKNHPYDKIIKIFDKMIDVGVQPNVHTFNVVMDACGTAPKPKQQEALKKAIQLLENIRKLGKIAPSSYVIFLRCLGFLPNGSDRQKIAKETFQVCCDDGLLDEGLMKQFERYIGNDAMQHIIIETNRKDGVDPWEWWSRNINRGKSQ